MPRGKKKKQKNNQDALTTRLMQLSLKMDDHIYCNKLISVTAAEEYLQEIARLKLKCPRTNVRTLQVIEKLTRYMKGVNAGDQIPAGYVPITHVEANRGSPEPSSPVYSVPDEDRTELLTQDCFNDYQIIDLTEDDTAIQEHENLIEKVKDAISNMGLRDEAQGEVADVDCSQSILDNFHKDNRGSSGINQQPDYYVIHVVNNQSKQILNEEVETENNHPEGTTFEQNCSQSVLDIIYSQNTKCSDESQDKVLEIHQNINETNLVTQCTHTKEMNSPITINDTLATPRPKFVAEAPIFLKKKVSSVLDFQKENKVKKSGKLSAPGANKENKQVRPKKTKNGVTENQKSQPKIKKSKTANKQNHPHKGKKAFNIVHGKGVIRSDISVDKPETVIYNENVECDLSWVENLRYVREINPEENDKALRIWDDNFWNNFSLPDNWNDGDFEV